MKDPIVPGPLASSEPLQPQDLVLTLLGTYVRPFETIWSGGMVALLGELGFSEGAARVALTRVVQAGLLERVRHGRLVDYRLTERTKRVLAEGDGRIFSLGRPRDDRGLWTVIWHQIPEDRRLERGRLARRLRFLGFGSVQDSVWVSPHDHGEEVDELLKELGVQDHTTIFISRCTSRAGLDTLVARAWDLSGLADRYEAFHAEFARYLPLSTQRRLQDHEAFLVRTRLMHLFRRFPPMDPELSEELGPIGAARSLAVETFHTLYEGLAPPSQQHFDAVASGLFIPTARELGRRVRRPRPRLVESSTARRPDLE